MTNPYFSETKGWQIPENAIADSLAEMAIDGRAGNEGIVLWLGRDHGDIAEITHLARLRGPLVERFPDFINIHPSLLNDVADLAIARQVRLVGQVHSHGPGYGLDLSPTDRKFGIRAPQYLSLVAPDYANTRAPVHCWGVHVFVEGFGYSRMSRDEAHGCLHVVPGPRLPLLTAGEE
jgi:proteasome lid subunit RPN8/RPN11